MHWHLRGLGSKAKKFLSSYEDKFAYWIEICVLVQVRDFFSFDYSIPQKLLKSQIYKELQFLTVKIFRYIRILIKTFWRNCRVSANHIHYIHNMLNKYNVNKKNRGRNSSADATHKYNYTNRNKRSTLPNHINSANC